MMSEWNETKLNEYINNKVEENQHLEYKAAKAVDKSDKKKTDISITISSMANADGGIVIFGIKEFDESDKKHIPEKIDPIDRQEFSKEWLEQVINSNIYPTIQNILIHPITLASSSNGVVYVVEVPKSFTAHQAKDLIYYRRYNFSSNPMYDYEIKELINRAQHPLLSLSFILEKTTKKRNNIGSLPGISFTPQHDSKKEPQYFTYRMLKVMCKNEGRILANYINCEIEIPEKFYKKNYYSETKAFVKENISYIKKIGDNTTRDVIGHSGTGLFSTPNYGPARYEPLLPQMKTKLFSIELTDNQNFEEEKLFWTIFADNSEPHTGSILMKDIDIIEIFEDK